MKIKDKRNSLTTHTTKKYARRNKSEIEFIAIHHSATTSGSAEAFARYHVNQLGWPGIAYHYVVNQDGTVDQCHDPEVVSFHVGNSNRKAIGICMVGDFRTQKISEAQLSATLELTQQLLKEFNLSVDKAVLGHIEFPNYSWKPCPSISMTMFRDRLKNVKKEVKYVDANVKYQDKDVKGLIIDGRTYVQVRELADLLKLQIEWEQQTKTVTLK